MRKLYGVLTSIVLTFFTIYLLFDTFVFTKTYSVESIPEEVVEKPAENEIIITEDSYKDKNIEIQIFQDRVYDTNIYIADIKVSDIKYLKTAFAKNTYGKNITEYTSVIAEKNQAILAINGDFYGVQEKGYVLKKGKIYRSTSKNNQTDLVILKDGSFKLIKEKETKLESLSDALELFSFGPALIENYEIAVHKNSMVAKEHASNPRTAIAILEPLHYLFFVSDGRTDESKGLSLYEMAEYLHTKNVSLAYNLDGGGSSSFYFNGKLLNHPINKRKPIERKVSDIVYIGY